MLQSEPHCTQPAVHTGLECDMAESKQRELAVTHLARRIQSCHAGVVKFGHPIWNGAEHPEHGSAVVPERLENAATVRNTISIGTRKARYRAVVIDATNFSQGGDSWLVLCSGCTAACFSWVAECDGSWCCCFSRCTILVRKTLIVASWRSTVRRTELSSSASATPHSGMFPVGVFELAEVCRAKEPSCTTS